MPFRFGAAVSEPESAKEWGELARRVEDLGYSTLLLADHIVNPWAPLPALVAAAAATTTLRVGTMVIDNDFRHPAILAKELATIDFLTEGRLEVGLGAGWLKQEYDATGIPFDPAAVRIARLAEAVTILKALWKGEPVNFSGDHYSITDLTMTPTPVQAPHPPIMIGGGGPQVLRLAAREASIISLAPQVRETGPDPESLTSSGVADRIQWVREAAGDRFDNLEFGTYYLGRAEIKEDARSWLTTRLEELIQQGKSPPLEVDEVLDSPMFLYGTTDELAERIVLNRERYRFNYLVFVGDQVESFAPIVQQLSGT